MICMQRFLCKILYMMYYSIFLEKKGDNLPASLNVFHSILATELLSIQWCVVLEVFN